MGFYNNLYYRTSRDKCLLGRPTYVSSRAALVFAAVLFSFFSVNFKNNRTSNLRDYQEERYKRYTTC